MSNDQSTAATALQKNTSNLSRAGYSMGADALKRQVGILNTAMDQGEPGYVRDAYTSSRALLSDANAGAEQGDLTAMLMGRRGASQGGNLGAQVGSPQAYGSRLAQAMFSNRIDEAQGNVEQMDKLMGFSLGLGSQAGSSSMAATGNALGAIPYMKNYNSTYANVLGALNAAGSIYGAGKSAGWFGGGGGGGGSNTFGLNAGNYNP